MDRLRRSFRDSFRRRKDRVPESSKPHQWQADESAVRSGTCTFAVKYLGCVEVFDSRGMQVCEEALKVLRGSRRRPVRAVLHVSGDGLRVVEEETKGLIVDQTIEKVSFCAPDRNHERGFSYICRDGTTRRWMCHGFLALRESGERLSHAVGCAFAVCLERKQKRDKECGVSMMFDAKNNTFTRTGSFRQQGLTERIERGIDVGPPKAPAAVNPFAIERPHATPSMLQRQGSCRGFNVLGESSPFKRQMSLRVNELPSNTARLNSYKSPTSPTNPTLTKPPVSPIPEVSPGDSVTALCQQLSQGLSQLTHSGSDDFNFNNQASVNQNTLNVNVTTVNNSYNRSITSTPTTVSNAMTPVSLNFSPNASRNETTTNRSANTSISSTTSTLPKPEQWLEIVNSTSPGPGKMDGSSPRRTGSFKAHSRAVSLDSASESFQATRQVDPFDAEWADVAAIQNTNSTNPFLVANATPKAFQIQLSHSLDERLLACSETVEVRQVKFHPGSINDNHILVLTSDNMLRLYQIENKEALNISVFSVGEKPVGLFPGSKTPFLDIYGEIAVDFDFGHPEISESSFIYDNEQSNKIIARTNDKTADEKLFVNVHTQTPEKIVPKDQSKKNNTGQHNKNWSNLTWPVYVVRGDASVYSINIDLNRRSKTVMRGPLPVSSPDMDQGDACSILCLNTVPQILCIALSNGYLCHSVLLDMEENTYLKMKETAKTVMEIPSKEMLVFENIELELGLATSEDADTKYKCPVFLQTDESKVGRYYATHSAGVHSVSINCVDELQSFVNGSEDVEPTPDIFMRPTSTEYLVCTKTSASEKANPVIGFSPYYEPMSVITMLCDGSLVSLGILYAPNVPKIDDFAVDDNQEVNSPLKKMLEEPFDQYIQKILRKAVTQPVLKLSSASNQSQEQCYELLQRAAQVFRDDYFKHHTKAREEMDKRVQTLKMLKKNQLTEIERMNNEREVLQEKAGNLAEKYEDIKDRQDELLKKCENLLMLVSRKKCEPSDAEKDFLDELKVASEKTAAYGNVIDKIKNKMKYQQIQMDNWKAQEVKKVAAINETHANTIKTNLQESTKKITEMIKEVNEYKKILNLK